MKNLLSIGLMMPFVLASSACKTTGGASSTIKSGFISGSGPTGQFGLEWPCSSRRFASNYQDGQFAKQDEYCEWSDDQKDAQGLKVCEFHSNFSPMLLNNPAKPSGHFLSAQGHNGTNTEGAAVDITSQCFSDPDGADIHGDPGRNSDPSICAKVREFQHGGLTYAFTSAAALGNAPSSDALASAGDVALNLPVIQLGLLTPLPDGCAYVADGSYPAKTVVLCTGLDTDATCVDIGKGLSVGINFSVSQVAGATAPTPSPANPPAASPAAPPHGRDAAIVGSAN